MELPAKRLAQVTRDLVQAGWRVEAEGKLIRPAGEFKLAVTTGIDWFELDGQVDFGGQSVTLPDLLAAARRGETMVALGDGSMGMLPEEWLKKYGMLADLGHRRGRPPPVRRAQAGLLDALLAAQPEIQVDAAFEKVRQKLRQFEGVAPLEPPPGFHGELRPYQREGLGWLDYLQQVRLRRHPGRRHGPGQDDPGARPAPAPAVPPPGEGADAWPSSPARSSSTGSQEAAQVHPEAPRARLHRARAATRSASSSPSTT